MNILAMPSPYARALRYFSFTVVAVLLLAMIPACGGPEDISDDIKVEEIALTRNQAGAPVVTGRMLSERERPINVAQVQVTLFGPTNERTGSATFTVRDLQPNEWKEFEEVIEADVEVQRARVRSVVVMN